MPPSKRVRTHGLVNRPEDRRTYGGASRGFEERASHDQKWVTGFGRWCASHLIVKRLLDSLDAPVPGGSVAKDVANAIAQSGKTRSGRMLAEVIDAVKACHLHN